MAVSKLATEVDETEGDVDNNALSVGQILKRARQELNLSLEAIAAEIRIRQQYLDSIERGNLSDLPGQVYVVGFIKTYATFLKLDYEELLRQLNLEKEVLYNYSNFNYAIPAVQQQYPSKKLVTISTILAGALLSSIYYLSQQDISEVSSGVQPLIDAVITSKEANETVAREESQLSVVTASEPVSHSAEKDSSSVVVAEPVDTSVNAAEPLKVTELPQAAVPVQSPETNQVQIIATQDAWVQILDQTGKTIYVRLMHAGDSYTLPSEQQGYTLNTGNAGGVKIRLGEQETPVLGATGKIIRGMALTSENLAPLILKTP